MLNNAESAVARELDLVKYIQRSRSNSLFALITLEGRQKSIVDKLSTFLMRESSGLSENSQDNFWLDKAQTLDFEHESRRIFNSSKEFDKRLIQAY